MSGLSTSIMRSQDKEKQYVTSSRPLNYLYSYNLDFSSFPLLCETIYELIRSRYINISKHMPFCSFMHAMTTCLNAWLFKTVTFINNEDRYSNERDAVSLIPQEMLVPEPIAEYLATINTVITPSGDTVYVNVPDCCLPRMTVPAVGDLPEIPPGSFGSVTADSHNAYECYVSPYITRRFVEATSENDRQYMPLPIGHFPQDTIHNLNLLGYFIYEEIPYEGLLKLRNYRFPNKDNMAGRLQLVPNLMYDVLHELSNLKSIFSMVHYHKIQRKSVNTGLVYARVMTAKDGRQNQSYLSSQAFTLYSPYSFEKTTIAQAILFALRRQRTQRARGLCYTYVDGLPPNGWELTINHNFMMAGAYAPEIGVIHPHLRVPLQQVEMNVGDRTSIIEDWCCRFLIRH